MIEFFLFTTDLDFGQKAELAGVDSVIVDWEIKGKEQRQKNCDLEINKDTPIDVKRMSQLHIPITVRINPFGNHTAEEINVAVEHGAKKIMLPMARDLHSIEKFLELLPSSIQSIIQVETSQLAILAQQHEFVNFPWDYVYIGLNDLMLDLHHNSIWTAVKNGLVDKICSNLEGRKYGFGGITILGGGNPIPIELLLHEYVRQKCSMSFLRRTFKREIIGKNIEYEIRKLKEYIRLSSNREAIQISKDKKALDDVLI